jgi:hypothetical protein
MAVSLKALGAAVLDVLDVLEGKVARIDPETAAAHRANLAPAAPDDKPDGDGGAPEPGPADGA